MPMVESWGFMPMVESWDFMSVVESLTESWGWLRVGALCPWLRID